VAYLVMRENVINRLYDLNVGYWQPDCRASITSAVPIAAPRWSIYLGLSEREIALPRRR